MATPPTSSDHLAALRALDLAQVLVNLGAERDRYDRAKWRLGGKIITVTGPLFYDHAHGYGGRGAIDLVMYLCTWSFREARAYLDGLPLASLPARPVHVPVDASRAETPFVPPTARPEGWPQVRAYLLERRALPATLIDELHGQSLVYADARRNAVFLRRDEEGQPTGAFLRGTHPRSRFKGLVPGTVRDRGWFHFTVGDRGLPQMVLTESAIDALSYYALLHGEAPLAGSGAYREIYLSTDGAGALPERLIGGVLAEGGLVRVAFDRDERGDQFWADLRERYSGAEGLGLWREAPTVGKDWNDLLVARLGYLRVTRGDAGGDASTVSGTTS